MENKNLTLGSLFDGSGGFPLGGLLSEITPVWASEIEPFPIRVTTKRLPQMKHYGDVSKLNGAELPPVDIITFGSPCQDMSVAGKRAGLSGSRSNLFYEAVRIVKEMRCKTNGEYPRFVVWENVPGAFSSNKGEDFKAVLEEICKIKDDSISVSQPESGKWTNAGEIVGDAFSVAWRVFDAQYWGVPQRRKRIYLVADFAGECAGEILFEQKSLSGDSPQSVCKRKTTPTDVKDCVGATSRNGIVLNDQGGNRMDITEDVTCTLRAEAHHPPCVLESAGFDLRVKRDHVPYDVWERQGYLQTTEGNVVHYGYIEKFIEELGKKFNIREIAFDRWGAVQMVQNLEGMGFTVVPFGQGFKDLSPPTKELMKLTLEQKIAHGGHPVLRWNMDNIFIRTDPAGNIKADKEKSTEKIDGAVATIMALDRAIRCGNDTSESVYNSRGILFI